MDLSPRVTIMAVAISAYSQLKRLSGPIEDVMALKKLFCKQKTTAIFPESRFIDLVDPTSDLLRQELIRYAIDRTAPNDILLFYFSGHGVPIGNNDYGFCTTDTQIHPEFKVPLPLNLVKFSDVFETLAAVKVDPVYIIDACYSGQAGTSAQNVFEMLKRQIQADVGSTYGILCSSTRIDQAVDTSFGGPFTQIICKVANEGMGGNEQKGKYSLSLQDLFNGIKREAEKNPDVNPQLFLGATLPDFAIVRNTKYKPREESITVHKGALKAFYNNGNPRKLKTRELWELGSIIHTTYNKLSYSPAWNLIKKVKRNESQLTKRGLSFVGNKIKIAATIRRDPVSDDWVPAPKTKKVNFSDL